MASAHSASASPRAIVGVGLVITAVWIASVLLLMGTSTYDTWGALFVGPLLVLLTVPALARQAARERDPQLLWLLLAALALKLLGAIVRNYVAFDLYEGVADAAGYHGRGVELSERFRGGDFTTGLPSLTGTDFIKLLTGIVYTLIRPSKLGGYLVFSWLGFLGLFLFYRAFVLSVPEGRARTYARLVFFLPSLIFWPSSIGKEAWMTLTLGIAAFGAAKALSGTTWRGLAVTGTGLWLAAMARPHIAGLAGVALAGAYLVRRPRKAWGSLAPVAKLCALVLVAVVAWFFVVGADRFLRDSGIDTRQGIASSLSQISAQTSLGGSQFVPSVLESPGRAPIALVTVLFRPFPTEAHNLQTFAAALEGSFLLLLSVWRARWLLAAARAVRSRQPYVVFCLMFAGLFIIGFSAVANFGILVRERVQLLPFYLVLLSIPPRPAETPSISRARDVGASQTAQ